MNIRKRLEQEADIDFQQFTAALIPNVSNVLGVRTPILRTFSKEILKSDNYKSILKTKKFKYMEEYMLKGMVIGLLRKKVENLLKIIQEFVPYIDNWAVCDSFCCSLKFTRNNLDVVWDFLQPYFDSKEEYEIRFAYVMLLNYYISEKYLDKIFELVDKFKDERYYARMSVAWLVSICYIKFPIQTDNYLKKSKLDDWTFNKSIQKICESMKIDKKVKEKVRLLKR